MTRREQLQHLGYLIARKNTAEDTHTWKRYAGQVLAAMDDLGFGAITDAEWSEVTNSATDWEAQFYADGELSTFYGHAIPGGESYARRGE